MGASGGSDRPSTRRLFYKLDDAAKKYRVEISAPVVSRNGGKTGTETDVVRSQHACFSSVNFLISAARARRMQIQFGPFRLPSLGFLIFGFYCTSKKLLVKESLLVKVRQQVKKDLVKNVVMYNEAGLIKL